MTQGTNIPTPAFVTSRPLPEFGLWERVEERRVPVSFDLELTARCNNDCRHCYINLPPGDREARCRELPLGEILDIATRARDMGALWCLLTGGEPLLRPDFGSIYQGLRELGLLVSVFTNACLVTDEHVRLFQALPPRDVEVTVYGATRETYEAVTRTPGSYVAFRRGLARLAAAGVPVVLKAMALCSNLHEFEEIARFCRAHTADAFRWDADLHLRYDGDPVRNEEIRSERLTPEEILTLEAGDPERRSAVETLCAEPTRAPSPGPGAAGPAGLLACGAGTRSFSVTAAGEFALCSSLRHPATVVDVRVWGVERAWRELVPRVRGLRQAGGELVACATCPAADLCASCPAHAYLETGRLESRVESFCRSARERQAAMMSGVDPR